jgi:hypothetical protein
MQEPEKKTFYRSLKVVFVDKEKIQMAEQIAGDYRKLRAVEDELDSIKKRYASEIKCLEAGITSTVEKLNSGWDMRKVECEEIRDYDNGSVCVWRRDTAEIVEERAMTAEERQGELPLEKPEDIEPEVDALPPETETATEDSGGIKTVFAVFAVDPGDFPDTDDELMAARKKRKRKMPE